jgi:uncharacterized protein YggU (UPF0235/DUF167 family)
MTAQRLQVKVKPQRKSAPVEGKANADLVALVAKHFKVPIRSTELAHDRYIAGRTAFR